jgi:hypothetical protein
LAKKAARAVVRKEAALEFARRLLAEHEAAQPAGDDPEAIYQWKRACDDHILCAESSQDAFVAAQPPAERAREEADERAADAKHCAQERAAEKDTARVGEADGLAAKLAEIEPGHERTAAANASRGKFQFSRR